VRSPSVLFVLVMLVLAGCARDRASVATATVSPTTSRARASLEPYYSQYVVTQLAQSRFHARYDQRDFAAIYIGADARLRAQITEDRFVALLSGVWERLGLASGRSREIRHEFRPISGAEDVDITVVMDATFEKGSAIETFIWRVTPSNLTYLVSYDVRYV
jgi:hypothetical protein